jgi:hypothetical protein
MPCGPATSVAPCAAASPAVTLSVNVADEALIENAMPAAMNAVKKWFRTIPILHVTAIREYPEGLSKCLFEGACARFRLLCSG